MIGIGVSLYGARIGAPEEAQPPPGAGSPSLIRVGFAAPWSPTAATLRPRLTSGWEEARKADRPWAVPWTQLQARDVRLGAAWLELDRGDRSVAAPYAFLVPLRHRPIDSPWRQIFARDTFRDSLWGALDPVPTQPITSHTDVTHPADRSLGGSWGLTVPVRQTPQRVPWGRLTPADRAFCILWEGFITLRRTSDIPYDEDTPEPPLPPPPPRKVIVVLNNVTVHRLPDFLPIQATAVELATNVDSWSWSGRLALADRSDLELIKPTVSGQRRVRIEVNGYVWHIRVEDFDDDRRFAEYGASVRGRSDTARLAAPYAMTRSKDSTQDRLAQQLIIEELENTGFTVDYQTVDWLVHAGAWNYQELTPIEAISRVVRASGAVLQSHRFDDQLIVAPRYPVSPWDWTAATPDGQIPEDLIDGMRLQTASKPMFDAVFVAGELWGVSARVRRSGSAGETFASEVVDPLITHTDPARERGRNILADRGEQALVSLDIPLFAEPLGGGEPGLVLPLSLQDVAEDGAFWRGLVTGTAVRATRQGKELEVEQTLDVERHYSDAN